ncbi:MAG TPA: transglutaminase-like domain-containing protein [Planctomycetota bacterium]|nr:transglutaminase-like domain-containing protein [Planctomycetota bacterium]
MRRALPVTVILSTLLGVCSCESLPGYREPEPAEKPLFSRIGTHVLPAERTLEMTCEVTVSEIPTDAKEVRVWIPFPQANAHQSLIEPTITHPTTYRPVIRHDEKYGSQVLYVSGEAPVPERFVVSYVTRVGRARMDHHNIVPPPPIDDNALRTHFAPDLEPVHIAPFDGENLSDDERKKQLVVHEKWIEMKVAEVIAFGPPGDDNVPAGARGVTAPGDTRIDDFNRARAVYDWVLDTLEPDNVPRGGPRRTVREILDDGRGDASDYALVTVALLRAVGIPSRIAGGVMLDENKSPDLTDAASPAAWVRFVVNGRAWSACDPWTADRCPELRDYMFRGLCANRVHLWTGPRPQLVPEPVEGTPVVFSHAFAEVDEKPVRTDTVIRFRDVSP